MPPRASRPALGRAAALLAAAAIAAPVASPAASYTWSGAGGASNSWSNSVNWLGGTPATAGGSDVELYFVFSDPAATSTAYNTATEPFTLNKLVLAPLTATPTRTIAGNGPLNFVANGAIGPRIEQNGPAQSTIVNALTIGGGVNLTLAGSANTATTLSGKISGAGSITVSSSPWVLGNAANDFSGGITMTGGQLIASANNAFGTGALDLQGGTLRATNTANVSVANAVQIAGNLNLGSSSPATSKLTLTGPITIMGGVTRTLTMSGSNPVVFAGTIGESGGAGGFDVAGNGLLEFAGSDANTYSGLTRVTTSGATLLLNKTGANAVAGNLTISSGMVKLGQSNQISDNSSVSLSGGVLNLNGNSDTVGQISGLSGFITSSSAGTSVLTVGGTGSSTVTLGATIQDGAGVVGIVKKGTDVLVLTGVNSHSGGTTVESGQLVLNGDSVLGSGALVANGGILRTSDLASRSFTNAFQIGGDMQFGIVTTQSTLTLAGATTILGTNATRVISLNSAASGNLNPVILSGAIGDGGNNNGLTIQGISTGNSAQMTFGGGASDTAANTYTGLTSVGGAVGAAATTATLALNKADGTDAIRGDLTVKDRGVVVLNRGNQIANTSTVTVTGSTAVLDMNGQSETVSAVVVDARGSVQSGAAGAALNATNSFDLRSGTVGVALGGAASLAKTTSGTVTLSSANTYTGATSVNAGTLILSGAGDMANSSSIQVASGAVLDVAGVSGGYVLALGQALGGNGTIRGDVTVDGMLAPGSSAGLLTFENSLSLGGDSQIVMELAGASRGVSGGYDAIDVGTMLTYNGDLVLYITSGLSVGTYNLFDFASSAGGLTGISFSGGSYSATWTDEGGGLWSATDSGSGQTFAFNESTGELQVVPEPSAVVLAGLGLAVVMGSLRRSRRMT